MYMHELMLLSKPHVIQNYQLKIHILVNKQEKANIKRKENN